MTGTWAFIGALWGFVIAGLVASVLLEDEEDDDE
jgi:hypothetical protein